MRAGRLNQLPPAQVFERELDRALRESGFLRDRPQAGRDWPPTAPLCGVVEPEIDEKSGRLAIMANQVAHQNIEDVIVDRHSPAETRHGEVYRYTDKWTAI